MRGHSWLQACLLACLPVFVGLVAPLALAHAQDGTLVQRNDKVNNVIVLDGKLVVRQQLPGDQSGIRINPNTLTQETYAKEQAIENRLEEAVQPNKPSKLVKGEMDNTIQAEGVFAIKRSDGAKACVEIGAVGDGDCVEEKK